MAEVMSNGSSIQGVNTPVNRVPTFQYVQPTDEQKALMQTFRDQFEGLATAIRNAVLNGRGRSLALTKLEEASFWLNKAISNND